jgi:superfamily II DNA/RNA helicase
LYKSLTKHRFSVGALHGDMAQSVRFSTLERFKAGELRLLVCSDVAARGIDIGGLSHVFNFDVPHHSEDYVHRIGRTGRAGLEGHAFTIASPDDRLAVEAIEKLINHPIPPVVVEGLDPVDWAEDDGRRRRGRGGRAAPSRKAEPKKPERRARTPREAPPADAEAPPPAPAARERDRDRGRDRDRDRPRRDRDAAPPREAAQAREDSRPVPPRDEPRRDFRRDDRRERYRRDDDLGPAVLGFGDDVPAFMLLRPRRTRTQHQTETDA